MSINKSKNQFIEELIIERLPDPKINDIKNLCYFPFSQESNLSLVDIYKAWQEFFNKVDYQNFNYNLYLHVPFCRSKCLYCNYYSLVEPSKESRLIYLKNLANQLKFLAPLFKNIKFSSIFLGGGTPSYLADKELMFCLDLIHQNLNFKNHIRKAFEVNPKDLNYNKLLLLKKYKFNEISMGVQSLNEKVLSKNNRQYQSYDKIKKILI